MQNALDDETFSQIKSTIERFVTDRLMPNETRLEIEDEIPEEIVQEMARSRPVRADHPAGIRAARN